MNEEKQNQAYFKEAFRVVHAPQGLAERVMNMEELKNKKKAGSVAKWLAVAALLMVILFAGSNGIVYAMTGSTWVETIVYNITLKGVEYVVELEESQRDNGETWYTGTIQEGNGDVSTVAIGQDGIFGYVMVSTDFSHHLSVKDGRVCLIDGDINIDVTEDVNANGQVSGTYEINGYTKEYKVWKDGEYYGHEVKTIYDGMEEEFEGLTPGQSDTMIAATPTPTPEP